MLNRWKSILGLKCPRCSKGDLFIKQGLVVYSSMLEMHETCPHCHLKYDLEPGFWLGALWTSYPIVIVIETPFLILAILSEGNTVWYYLTTMILALLVAFPVMLRLGRSLWIHLNVRSQH